jgi:hypothetical protein
MKWFQENRWLGTFLIVFGVCVLFCGTIFYFARSKWSAARGDFDKATAELSRLERLDPFPNDINYRKLKVLLADYKTALDKLKEQLKTEVAPAPPLAPNEFQSRLRQAAIATLNRARASNVKLPDHFSLGFDEFTTTLPKTDLAPLLGQELGQIQMLVNILVDARVDGISSLHRMPLPEEKATPAPKATPPPARKGRPVRGAAPAAAPEATPPLVQRNVVDITFKAAPGAARKVLNEIDNSTGQFFVVRTLHVRNEKDKGPPREKTAEPMPAATESPAPNQQQAPAGPLNFIVGNEHLEVSATIEMLRFNF